MGIVAGVDFGTLSVRISIFDKDRGKLGMATAEYPLHRSPKDPNLATQSHYDQMDALTRAMHEAVKTSGIAGREIRAIALDTTGSSVIPVGEGLVSAGRVLPLGRPPGGYGGGRDNRRCARAEV